MSKYPRVGSVSAKPKNTSAKCKCGEAIPELRQEKVPGCQRCADCQQDEELRMKQGSI